MLGDPSTAKSQFLKFIEKVRTTRINLVEKRWKACLFCTTVVYYIHFFELIIIEARQGPSNRTGLSYQLMLLCSGSAT